MVLFVNKKTSTFVLYRNRIERTPVTTTVTMNDLPHAQSLLQQSRGQYTVDYTNYLVKTT